MVFFVTIVAGYLTDVLLLAFLGDQAGVNFNRLSTAGVVICRAVMISTTTSNSTLCLGLTLFWLTLTPLTLA